MRRIIGIVTALALAAGCGSDGDTVTMEDYFAELLEVRLVYEDASTPIQAALEESTDPLGDAKRLFPEFVGVIRTYLQALEAMDYPAGVDVEHSRAIERGHEAIEAFEVLLSELDGITDPADLDAFYAGATFDAARRASFLFGQTCEALQLVALREGFPIDLRC